MPDASSWTGEKPLAQAIQAQPKSNTMPVANAYPGREAGDSRAYPGRRVIGLRERVVTLASTGRTIIGIELILGPATK